MDNDIKQVPKRQPSSLLTERVWRGVVGMCLVAATFFLWNDQLDAAFVVATLGAVAWFMPLRNRLHRSSIEADAAQQHAENEKVFEDRDED